MGRGRAAPEQLSRRKLNPISLRPTPAEGFEHLCSFRVFSRQDALRSCEGQKHELQRDHGAPRSSHSVLVRLLVLNRFTHPALEQRFVEFRKEWVCRVDGEDYSAELVLNMVEGPVWFGGVRDNISRILHSLVGLFFAFAIAKEADRQPTKIGLHLRFFLRCERNL